MNRSLPDGLENCLLWSDKLGMGWHSAEPMTYGGDYFASYVERDNTGIGVALTAARCLLVTSHWSGEIVDIGIGGGAFVREMQAAGVSCYGFDVSGAAVSWLRQGGAFLDPYSRVVDAISCWDSLEHIPDPGALLAQVRRWVFLSMPIYADMADCLASKHYKPGEHLWYFTHHGLVAYFERHGFRLVEHNNVETLIGRESIISYAFERVE